MVPARVACIRVAADLDPQLAALAEPMAVVVHALLRGDLAAGQRVLVISAPAPSVCSRSPPRGDSAPARCGSPRAIRIRRSSRAPRRDARAQRSRDRAVENLDAIGREAPIDLVVETVGGQADTLRAASAAVRPGGTVAVVGFFLGGAPIDPFGLMLKEVTLVWSYCYGSARAGAGRRTSPTPST